MLLMSFAESKDELEEILRISDIAPSHLQHEIMGLPNIIAYEKLRSEKSSKAGYLVILGGFARSPFRDFESYLRFFVRLNERSTQLILKQNNS